MNIQPAIKVHNKFEAVLTDSKTGKVKGTAVAYNLVTDQYYSWVRSGGGDNIQYISVGTGVGTPAASDTSLFQYLTRKYAEGAGSLFHRESSNQWSTQLVVTFDESEANGELTEVGLSVYNSGIVSHAMFTDSESQTITITKTNTDRLTITATVYITITFPANIVPQAYSSLLPVATNPQALQYLETNADVPTKYGTEAPYSAPWILRHLMLAVNNRQSGSECTFPLGLCLAADTQILATSWRDNNRIETITAQGQPAGRRVTGNAISSSDWNATDTTYQIHGVMTALGLFKLPNSSIFPPYELSIERTADGSTTEFNFGVAELSSSVSVYIDGVLQSSGYTWNRKDFNLRQAWISQHGTYLIEFPKFRVQNSGSYSSSCWGPVIGTCELPIFGSGSSTWNYTTWQEKNGASSADFPDGSFDYIYDFGSNRTVNTLWSFRNSSLSMVLYYSSNKTTWTEAARISAGSESIEKVTFTAVSARYWKLSLSASLYPSEQLTTMLTRPCGAFDEEKPQLKFATAPQAGSVVKIVANTEYPIKNANWLIDQTIVDFDITKAGS